jgi:opacity protein-like surface antigen
MTVRSSLLAGLAVLTLSAGSASAADLFGGKGGSIKDGGYQTEIVASRQAQWYVRGDFSFAGNDIGGVFAPPTYQFSDVGIGRNWSYGGGVGYYFSKSVRGDLTLDARQTSKVTSAISYGNDPVMSEHGLRSTVGLANLYYDFDMRSHFTPYLGVGLGFASNKTNDGTVSASCAGCTFASEGATKTSAAGALMAGFSAKVFDRVSLDAGYRFLYLGDAKTGTFLTTSGTATTGAPNINLQDLSAHEFRVGLRVDIR